MPPSLDALASSLLLISLVAGCDARDRSAASVAKPAVSSEHLKAVGPITPLPASSYPMGEPVQRRMVVEHVYRYAERRYLPPVKLTLPKTRADSSHTSPEAALTAQLAAIDAADLDWLIETWAPQSRAKFIESLGASKQDWIEQSRKSQGAEATLLRRADSPPYVYLWFKWAPKTGRVVEMVRPLVQADDGKWYTELRDHDPINDRWGEAGDAMDYELLEEVVR